MEMLEEQIWVISATPFKTICETTMETRNQVKVSFQDHPPKCAKNEPKSGSSKAIEPQNVHKKGSFKTIEDGSKKDTSFKTIANRVNNLNPQYMVPVDEVTQVISDPKSRKKAQPATEQPSSSPPPPGSWFNPIYIEPGSVSIDSTRDLQALFPNSFDCIGDMQGEYNIKADLTVPPVQHGRWKVSTEYKEEIKKELAEMVQQRIITKQTEPTPWVSSLMYPREGKQQAEDMPWPQGIEQGNHLWEPQSTNPQGDSPCPHGSHQDLKGRQQQGLLWGAPYRGSITPHNVQHPPQKVQIPMCPLWTQNVTG